VVALLHLAAVGELSGLDFLFFPVLLVLPVEEVGDPVGCGGEGGGDVDGVVVVVDGDGGLGTSSRVSWGIPLMGSTFVETWYVPKAAVSGIGLAKSLVSLLLSIGAALMMGQGTAFVETWYVSRAAVSGIGLAKSLVSLLLSMGAALSPWII